VSNMERIQVEPCLPPWGLLALLPALSGFPVHN